MGGVEPWSEAWAGKRPFCGPSGPGENLRPPSPMSHNLFQSLSYTCEEKQRRRGEEGEGEGGGGEGEGQGRGGWVGAHGHGVGAEGGRTTSGM